MVDAKLTQPLADRTNVPRIAKCETPDPCSDPGTRDAIAKIVKPLRESLGFTNFYHFDM